MPQTNEISVYHFRFTREDLECVPKEEVAFLLQIGGLIHEVISLQKYIYMSSQGVDNPIERMAENAQGMYFYRLLAGSLFEGWELLTKRHREYKRIIAKYKSKLDSIAKLAFDKLQKYFSDKNNACQRIRNKFSHHHDYGEIIKILSKWPSDDKLDIYLSETHANCRYMASDIVTSLAMLGTTEIKDMQPKLYNLIEEISEVARAFIEVVSEYLSLIFQEVAEKKNLKGKEIKITDVPSLHELRLRYFVANPENTKSKENPAKPT